MPVSRLLGQLDIEVGNLSSFDMVAQRGGTHVIEGAPQVLWENWGFSFVHVGPSFV